jgi:SM-20-related protein
MEDLLDYISQKIYQNSYVVVDGFMDELYRKALLMEQTDLLNQGQFKVKTIDSRSILIENTNRV